MAFTHCYKSDKINMVMLEISTRKIFRDKVKNFCKDNDVEITYLSNTGNGKYGDFYNIEGSFENTNKVSVYIQNLENERSKKSFWYRIWN